jgi:hypothetical protein
LVSTDADYQGDSVLPVQVSDNDAVETWHNSKNRHDVSGDGVIAPLDVLVIINELNSRKHIEENGKLSTPYSAGSFHYDVNGDTYCTSSDALVIINFLNSRNNGEGENIFIARPTPIWLPPSAGNSTRRTARTIGRQASVDHLFSIAGRESDEETGLDKDLW